MYLSPPSKQKGCNQLTLNTICVRKPALVKYTIYPYINRGLRVCSPIGYPLFYFLHCSDRIDYVTCKKKMANVYYEHFSNSSIFTKFLPAPVGYQWEYVLIF